MKVKMKHCFPKLILLYKILEVRRCNRFKLYDLFFFFNKVSDLNKFFDLFTIIIRKDQVLHLIQYVLTIQTTAISSHELL